MELKATQQRIEMYGDRTVYMYCGEKSDKVMTACVLETHAACLHICKYKDGKAHSYGEEIKTDMIGEPIVTIVWGTAEGLKQTIDNLQATYDLMVKLDAEENSRE